LERAVARKNRKGKPLEDATEGAELGKKEKRAIAKEVEEADVQRRIEERIRDGALITVRKLMRGKSRPSLFPRLVFFRANEDLLRSTYQSDRFLS